MQLFIQATLHPAALSNNTAATLHSRHRLYLAEQISFAFGYASSVRCSESALCSEEKETTASVCGWWQDMSPKWQLSCQWSCNLLPPSCISCNLPPKTHSHAKQKSMTKSFDCLFDSDNYECDGAGCACRRGRPPCNLLMIITADPSYPGIRGQWQCVLYRTVDIHLYISFMCPKHTHRENIFDDRYIFPDRYFYY